MNRLTALALLAGLASTARAEEETEEETPGSVETTAGTAVRVSLSSEVGARPGTVPAAVTGSAATESTDDGATSTSSGPAQSYTIPDPPALTAVGSSGSEFDEPSSPSDFAVAAGNFFNESGELQAGGAVEFGLRALGAARGFTAQQYRDSPFRRTWARTFLSAATAADGTDILGALGARAVLLDGADPLLSAAWFDAAARARAACETLRHSTEDDWVEKYTTCLDEAWQSEAKSIEKGKWNAFGMVWSAAWISRFADGALSGFASDEVSTWVSVAGPVGDGLQLGGAVGWGQSLADDPHELSTTLVARGGIKRTRLRAEIGHVLYVPTDGGDLGHSFPVLLGGEFEVEDDVWLSSSFGLSIDPTNDLITMLSAVTFRWGQETEPSFMPETKPADDAPGT